MDKEESGKLTEVATDVKWIKQSISDLLDRIRTTDGRVSILEKKVVLNDQMVMEQKIRFDNHLEDTEPLLKDHKENTLFRKNTEFFIKIAKWVVPPSLITNMIGALILLSEKL